MDALTIMQRLGSGKFMDMVSEALSAVADEVVATGNPGAVAITLNISTQSQGNPVVAIGESIQCKPPKSTPRGAIFFALDGELHKEDPRQTKMTFQAVDHETGEITDVSVQKVEVNV